jgi:hypothetical protein
MLLPPRATLCTSPKRERAIRYVAMKPAARLTNFGRGGPTPSGMRSRNVLVGRQALAQAAVLIKDLRLMVKSIPEGRLGWRIALCFSLDFQVRSATPNSSRDFEDRSRRTVD